MKNPSRKAHLVPKKVVSIIIALSIISSLSACATTQPTNGQIDDRMTEVSSRETIDPAKIGLSEPNQSIETMAETTTETTIEETTEATTEAPQLPVTEIEGDYEYTLYEGTEYEMTIRMDIPIDSYTFGPDDYSSGAYYWNIQQIANDRNWLEDGLYTLADIYDDSAEDVGTHTLGFSPIYMLNCEGYRVYLEVEYYDDALNGTTAQHQMSSIKIRYITTDSLDPAFEDPAPEQMDVIINFAQHYENYEYHCDRKKFGGSFEDIVILQYVIIQCRKHEGDSSIFYGYFPNAQIVDGEWVINLP